MISPGSRADGFTLFEMLIALLLFALVAAGLTGAIRLGLRSWERVDRLTDLIEPVTAAQTLLRGQIEQALAWRDPRNNSRPVPAAGRLLFEGGPRGMRFVASLPERLASPGLNWVAVQLRPDANALALAVGWRRLAGDAGTADGGAPDKTVLEDVAEGHFSYYGNARGLGQPGWTDQWTEATTLPRLIRLDLRFTDSRRVWPPLIVALPAQPDTPPAATAPPGQPPGQTQPAPNPAPVSPL